MIFLISYLQSYFPPKRSRKIMGQFRGILANIMGALLGTVTPFCSCSSIPIFMGFTSAGLPLGVTFSFLISSPMVDLGSLVLLMSIFGARIAVVYVLVGLVIAVVGGSLIERLRMEEYVADFVKNAAHVDAADDSTLTVRDRIAQDQEAYQQRYDGLVARYDKAKARFDDVTAAIAAKESQRERLTGFIETLARQDKPLEDFDKQMWSGVVECVMVGKGGSMTVEFRDGTRV